MNTPLASFELPFPPSVNELKGIRHTPKSWKQFKRDAGWMILKQLIGQPQAARMIKERVRLVLRLSPRADRSDADNRLKAAQDVIVQQGILRDDSKRYIESSMAIWDDTVKAGCCIVELWGCEGA